MLRPTTTQVTTAALSVKKIIGLTGLLLGVSAAMATILTLFWVN